MAGSREFADLASARSYARYLERQGYVVVIRKKGDRYFVIPT